MVYNLAVAEALGLFRRGDYLAQLARLAAQVRCHRLVRTSAAWNLEARVREVEALWA